MVLSVLVLIMIIHDNDSDYNRSLWSAMTTTLKLRCTPAKRESGLGKVVLPAKTIAVFQGILVYLVMLFCGIVGVDLFIQVS